MTSEAPTSTSAKMKVLLVVPWDEARGGVISVVDNLARQLTAGGHEAVFFHPGPPLVLRRRMTKLGFQGVQLRLSLPSGSGLRGAVRALVFPFLFTLSFLQLLWFLRSRQFQIVNIHYPADNVVYFALCRRLIGFRLVTSVHGRDAFYQERPKPHYSRAFSRIVASSDLLVLPSDAYRRLFLEAFPEARDRTTYIHNGIDPERFAPAADVPHTASRSHFLLCVAELQEYKAIDVLLQAAQPLLAEDPSLTLVLAGDGPLRATLEALATSLGIRRQTMFLGTQGAPEIVRLLHGCDTMVLPSRMEPFGIVVIEAMACGAPVVATRAGGIPEIVEHDVSGVLVPPENPAALTAALRRVLGDDALRQRMVRNGYARVMDRFRAAHNGAAYLSAFASVIKGERSLKEAASKAPAPVVGGDEARPAGVTSKRTA